LNIITDISHIRTARRISRIAYSHQGLVSRTT
jgi:hypothetical protein